MPGEVERWCEVTGGQGFVVRHLVEMLIKDGTYLVIVADLGSEFEFERHEENGVLREALRSDHARYVSVDLRDKARVFKACRGAEVIVHIAAPHSSVNYYQLHYSVNVLGTRNVIDACVKLKVKRLIYTSSLAVVFDGVHGIFNGDKSLPYPTKHNDLYLATKSEGEALVIDSNGTNGLLTCCIRPSSIFGPGDKLLVPTLISSGKAGQSKKPETNEELRPRYSGKGNHGDAYSRTLSGRTTYVDSDISDDLRNEVIDIAIKEGATLLNKWFVGCCATDVVSEGISARRYLGHCSNLITPLWILKTPKEKEVQRLVHLSTIHTDSRHGVPLRSGYATKDSADGGFVEFKRVKFLGSRRSFEMLKPVVGDNNGNGYIRVITHICR